MFGKKKKINCDCCKKDVIKVMEVCEECYTNLIEKQPLETKVRSKMSEEDLKNVDENLEEEQSTEEYLEVKKNE